jgi:uncharacterized membrane-anchored protein
MRWLLIACIALSAVSGSADAKVPQNDQERDAAVQALVWRDGEQLKLPLSNGTLQAPKEIRQLLGPDARSVYEALNAVAAPHGMEAVLYEPKTKSLVFFQKYTDGFVRLDDWDDVDADAMLRSVSEGTEEGNIKRKAAGVPAIHVVGWLQRPHLDRATNTVQWAFELNDETEGPVVNNVALVLGRDGFEKLTWAGTKNSLNDGLLKTAQASFSFPAGGRYADFQNGDKVAEYGIAGLVAAVLGAKVAAKLGIFAMLLVFAKKFGVILLVAAGGAIAWLRKMMGGGEQPPTSPPAAT